MDFKRKRSVSRPKNGPLSKHEDELDERLKSIFDQEPLFERLHSEPLHRRIHSKTAPHVKKAVNSINRQPMLVKVAIVVALSLTSGGLYFRISRSPEKTDVTQVSGVVTENNDQQSISTSLPEELPSFSLLYPLGYDHTDLKTVKISPAGNDPVYAYSYEYKTASILVSQQKVPQTFEYNRSAELERVARDFLATNIIQVDDSKLYHGLNDKTKEQSLLMIKDDRLLFIKSSLQLSDDEWASFYLSLRLN